MLFVEKSPEHMPWLQGDYLNQTMGRSLSQMGIGWNYHLNQWVCIYRSFSCDNLAAGKNSEFGAPMNILDPQGPIGAAEKTILFNSIAIMLAIVVPTIFAILAFAWWFRDSNTRATYLPDWEYSGRIELVVWSIPALTVMLLGGVAWIGVA